MQSLLPKVSNSQAGVCDMGDAHNVSTALAVCVGRGEPTKHRHLRAYGRIESILCLRLLVLVHVWGRRVRAFTPSVRNLVFIKPQRNG